MPTTNERYLQQLKSVEWRTKRLEILVRDDFQCCLCLKKRSTYINLIKSFGIQTHEELKHQGYSISNHDEWPTAVSVYKSNLMELAHFTGEPAASLIPENLYYAKQWKENLNLLRLGCVDWICFYDLPSTNERHVDLNIHHTYYIEGKDAWDYDNSALQTLCIDCHQKEHQTKSFPIYEDHKQLQVLKDAKFCMRCDGSGYLPQFNYYLDGVCFSCGGDGVILD